ncbi:OST-HTH/LOTUS domain-containing protein [Cohnella faecalis]|uniref:OST-HTH/LOTUS domain-containing protein n=1 Tax=Cohnella faecalis TaxID=2315694 RepID=UPI002279ABBC|nr:OST-HTH/LOTUS domain-containing protein [Cohnella faecalis]
MISASINDVDDENGWAFLAVVGNLILKKKPDFDPRNFGFAKLTPLIKSLKQFEIEERESGDSKIKHVYVRNQPIRRFE